MATVPVLDTNRRIIEITNQMQQEMQRAGAPSPYFEELWYSLTILLAEINTTLADHEARLVAGGL